MQWSSKIQDFCKFGLTVANLTRNNLVKQNTENARHMTSFKNKFFWKPHRYKANSKPKLSVILLEDDVQFGRKGEVAKVERGYARHTLIPNNLADYATKENLEKYGCKESSALPRAPLKLLNRIKNINLKMARPRDEPWEISNHHVAYALRKQSKLHVPVHCLQSDFEAISEFGEYQVNITVNKEATVTIKVIVEEWQPEYKEGWQDILSGGPPEEEQELTL